MASPSKSPAKSPSKSPSKPPSNKRKRRPSEGAGTGRRVGINVEQLGLALDKEDREEAIEELCDVDREVPRAALDQRMQRAVNALSNASLGPPRGMVSSRGQQCTVSVNASAKAAQLWTPRLCET